MTSLGATLPGTPLPRPSLRTWLLATRPKTLAAGFVPVSVGTALAFGAGVGNALPALAALVGALLIQIGTNLTNDYYDFKKGADTAARLGPTRVTQAGLIAPRAVLGAAIASFALAFTVGIYLVSVAGLPILVIGLLSLLCGYAYTGGPYPLGYNGLGDLFVFVFFGLVAVGGTYYVQALALPPLAWLSGVPVGALAVGLLVVNNLRDAPTDAPVGKRTLVVRFGAAAGRAEYVLVLVLAFVTPVLLWALGLAGAPVLLPLLALPLAVPSLQGVFTRSGAALNATLAQTARLLLVFGVLFALGLYGGAR
jgi:1,4-dihydroxy-2-naphthoate octaprenyltransferase